MCITDPFLSFLAFVYQLGDVHSIRSSRDLARGKYEPSSELLASYGL
jgi:hypothetical protein